MRHYSKRSTFLLQSHESAAGQEGDQLGLGTFPQDPLIESSCWVPIRFPEISLVPLIRASLLHDEISAGYEKVRLKSTLSLGAGVGHGFSNQVHRHAGKQRNRVAGLVSFISV
jgi:hypothetical protein